MKKQGRRLPIRGRRRFFYAFAFQFSKFFCPISKKVLILRRKTNLVARFRAGDKHTEMDDYHAENFD